VEGGYRAVDPSARLAISNPHGWSSATIRKLADRAAAIELNQPSAAPSVIRDNFMQALGVAQLWVRRGQITPPAFEVDPSTIPKSPVTGAQSGAIALAHLVPYRVSFEFAQGGLAVAWLEPALRVTRWFSILSIVEPLDIDVGQHRVWGTLGIQPALHWLGFSWAAGPRTSFSWTGTPGPQLGVQFTLWALQDRIGLSVGSRNLFLQESSSNVWFVSLSFSDINGMAYWLSPWGKTATGAPSG
jgi:hypothetical protein